MKCCRNICDGNALIQLVGPVAGRYISTDCQQEIQAKILSRHL